MDKTDTAAGSEHAKPDDAAAHDGGPDEQPGPRDAGENQAGAGDAAETSAEGLTPKRGTAAGREAKFIYGKSSTVFVYRDPDGAIQWEVDADALTPTQSRVHYSFDKLRMRVMQCVPKKKHDFFRDQLGQALFHSLGEPDVTLAVGYFEAVETEIRGETQRDARFKYFGFGSAAASVMILSGLAVAYFSTLPDVTSIALAAAAGAGGAWASILQRVWKVEVAPNETPGHLIFQGATRIVLGSLFSVAALASMKAQLLIPDATGNAWAVGLATFAAGFSERLVPELIGRFEAEQATTVVAALPKGGDTG